MKAAPEASVVRSSTRSAGALTPFPTSTTSPTCSLLAVTITRPRSVILAYLAKLTSLSRCHRRMSSMASLTIVTEMTNPSGPQ